MKAKQKSGNGTTATRKRYGGFTDDEKKAMTNRVREMKAGDADAEGLALAAIDEMTGTDRVLATRIHALIKTNAPSLSAKTWYGMPAYAKDGKVVCHFKPAGKFKTRYATFEFSDPAKLDDGSMWPVSYALTKLTGADEARIAALLKKALS